MYKLTIAFFIAMSPIVINAQINWSSPYTFGFINSPNDFISDNNGNIFVGGYFFDQDQDRNTMLLHLDETNGDSLSLASCKGPVECNNVNDILHLAYSSDKALYSAGNKNLGEGDYLAKISSGSSLSYDWFIDDLFDDIHHINQLIPVSDGIITVGQFSLFEFTVIKFDKLGHQIWSQKISVTEVGRDPHASLLKDETLALFYFDGLNETTNYLSFIRPDGDLYNTYQIDNQSIVSCSTQSQSTLSIEFSPNSESEEFKLVTYSTDGSRKVLVELIAGIEYPNLLSTDSGGNIYIAGLSTDLAENDKQVLTIQKYSNLGDKVWRYDTIFNDSNIYFSHMKLSFDESAILLLGQKDNKATLMLSFNPDYISNTKDFPQGLEILAYPNPVIETLNIQIPKSVQYPILHYELQSLNGNSIQHGKISQTLLPINFLNTPTGFYQLTINDGYRILATKKILKQ